MIVNRESSPRKRGALIVFACLFCFGFAWSFYTQHVWEDYYITYRASKNLATGEGLTFTAGERVHSFTSPLGVLLPALSSLLTGNTSDDGALWIFRIFSIGAYAGAGAFLWLTLRQLFGSSLPAYCIALLFGLECKIVDNSSNGMESGILLLFLGWMIYACLSRPPRSFLQIGLAWAGLMWSRPDSFIYIGFFGVGLLLFPPNGGGWAVRKAWFRTLVFAGLVTTAVYLPWIISATIYYGSPVPHTVVAKGLGGDHRLLDVLIATVTTLPERVIAQKIMFQTIFMPPYSHNTGWPSWAQAVSYWASLTGMFLWIVPGLRRETRILSFTCFGGLVYLLNMVGFPVPWYLPTVSTLALLSLVMTAGQLWEWARQKPKDSTVARTVARHATSLVTGVAALGFIADVGAVSGMTAYHLKWQQRIVERGNREPIGRWLKENASSPQDTVFLEPLGYIGFYSQLKMLDFPGLSSPEVVEARERLSLLGGVAAWPALISDLLPNWLVLRHIEAEELKRNDPTLLEEYYEFAKSFDVRDQVGAVPHLLGLGYISNDSYYEVYRRQPRAIIISRTTRTVRLEEFEFNTAFDGAAALAGRRFNAHAPSKLVLPLPADAHGIQGYYGVDPEALKQHTDGGTFMVRAIGHDGTSTELLHRYLNPLREGKDQGIQALFFALDPTMVRAVEFEIDSGPEGSSNADWTFWSDLRYTLEKIEQAP